ncbi:MAG: hypothetical protein IK137_03920 [Bacilli bacterium]|nr:hypothetical protein [Bacilli bacterium]
MKKLIIKGIFFVGIGFLIGQLLFGERIELIKKLWNKDTYYFLEEGVYNDYNNIDVNINRRIIENKDNKYHVYIGITRDKEVLEKLKSIYKKENINITVKEINLESQEFKTNVEQFDLLIRNTKDTNQILTIEEVVIANYQEIIKKQ